LCDICNEISKYANEFQKIYLFNKITEVNKKLPCNVYLPFLKDSTRNYIICHIPLEEIKIFKTKTRCPIMLTFEMIRMDEVNRINEEEDNFPFETSSSSAGIKNKRNKKLILLDQKINSSYEKDIFYNADYDLSKPLMISRSGEIKKSLKKNKTFANKKWFKSTNINIKLFPFHGKKRFDYLNDLEDKDIENDSKYTDYVSKFMKNSFNTNNSLDKIENSKGISLTSKLDNETDIDDNNKIKNISLYNSTIISMTDRLDIKKKLILNEENINNEQKNDEDEKNKGIKNISSSTDKIEDEINPITFPINLEEIKSIFGEPFKEKEKKLKNKSLFGNLNTYKIFRCIIKTNEDLRQEQFATQLINEFYQIFKLENTGCWLNAYEIISTGNNSGLVEMVNNSLSLDQLKQKTNHISLKDFYINYFGKGSEDSIIYKKAMSNFISSLAGYSLVCYFLQIKDRHNGNILIDNEGHIIHIDFGFLLSNAPGKGLKFENAPFKLSNDMVDCLGGIKGKYFMEFRKLLKKGFLAIHKHRAKIIILVEMMWCGHGKNLECFEMGQETIDALKARLNPKDEISKKNIVKLVDNLIGQSVDNWRTKWYDIFQYYVQGIFY
jgi:phosphatidylinositol 4-kinase